MGSLTRVQIDFAQSHLVFPTLIGGILLILGAAILITERRALLTTGAFWRKTFAEMDKLRFLGALALTVAYFSLMVPVGDIWPNTGMGFLLCSIPFLALTGILFMHERTPRQLLPVGIVSVVMPLLVWWLFADVLFLTLP